MWEKEIIPKPLLNEVDPTKNYSKLTSLFQFFPD